jgi:hypothetical protein
MRLSQDKSRRLTAMVWRERAKRWVPVALVLVLLFAGATYMLSNQLSKADRTLDVVSHSGTVTGMKRAGLRSAIAHVHLDDGRDVDALSQLNVIPPAGTHVTVSESRHASGRLSYDVKRLSD